MLIWLVLSSLQVTKGARNAKEKTEDAVWSWVSWALGFSNVFANSFFGLGHVAISHCVVTAKSQLYHVCPCTAPCPQSSNFQSALQSVA